MDSGGPKELSFDGGPDPPQEGALLGDKAETMIFLGKSLDTETPRRAREVFAE